MKCLLTILIALSVIYFFSDLLIFNYFFLMWTLLPIKLHQHIVLYTGFAIALRILYILFYEKDWSFVMSVIFFILLLGSIYFMITGYFKINELIKDLGLIRL